MKRTSTNNNEPAMLTPALSSFFSSLSPIQQSFFMRVFRLVYNYLLPMRSFHQFGGALSSYWAIPQLRAKYKLTEFELSLLMLIYHHTDRGNRYTCRAELFASLPPSYARYNQIINNFRLRGFVVRSWKNNKVVERSHSLSQGAKYITLSVEGLNLIKSLESDLKTLLYNTTVNSITT